MISLTDLLKEATSKSFNFSLDGKTIQTKPSLKDVTQMLRNKTSQSGGFVLDTFTVSDLNTGDSKKLTWKAGKKRYNVWLGQNLTKADLTKKADNWGTIK